MDALLVTAGTLGDIHPFIGLGQALRERGHHVTVISEEKYGSLARASGLGFVPLAQEESLPKAARKGLAHRLLLSVAGRWRRLARVSTIVPLLRPVYEAIASRYVPGQTVVVASSATLGARLAHDKLNVPLVTLHLSPIVFRGASRAPIQPPLVVPDWLPTQARLAAYWLVDHLVLDRFLGGPVNAYRAELGLPPVRRLLAAWRHSPRRVIGLFPEWFAPPQPGWPAVARLTGFPLFDPGAPAPLPPRAQEFLAAGEPPVVYAPGTAMHKSRRAIEETIAACRLAKRRALFVTRFRDQMPDLLPDTVRHFDYLPFGAILPQAAALIHHGGIGSAARALAAGIPQLIRPVRNDQFDNARRLEELGVAVVLRPDAYRSASVARALDRLLDSETVASRCRALASKVRERCAIKEACDLIEELHGSARGHGQAA
jgi:rhamnosyltransferase subunit B